MEYKLSTEKPEVGATGTKYSFDPERPDKCVVRDWVWNGESYDYTSEPCEIDWPPVNF